MSSLLFTPRRYQLKKEAAQIVLTGHPWIFRSHLSTAADVFADGQWISLVDAANAPLGYGIYEKEGLIGIRVLKQGTRPPGMEWLGKTLDKALAKRANLRQYADAFRALHGENDGLPGVVVDVYGKTAVLQTYSRAVDALGRCAAGMLVRQLGLENLVWKLPAKRKAGGEAKPFRRLRGSVPRLISFREGQMRLTADVSGGQKSGTFLDLRGLRKWISLQKLKGARVLNLFSYTGTLGLAAELAGATEIWNVDVSQGAVDFAKAHHTLDARKHKFIAADIFKWLPDLSPKEKFDFIIVDPPQMASQVVQVRNALSAYHQIYTSVVPRLTKGGWLVACCCTSRISPSKFRQEVDRSLGGRLRLQKSLGPEDDHPVAFPEGDYLKLLIYR